MKPKDTPSKLSDDLAKANDKLRAAKREHENTRLGVIERGVERGKRLAALRKEIEQEEAQVASVIESAKVGSPR